VPYTNEHSARVLEPLPQNSAVYARKQIAPGISIVLQRSKGDPNGSMKVQSYRFDKNQFPPQEAKSWLKKHNIQYTSFEPASEPSKQENRKFLINRITKEIAGVMV